MKWQTWAGDGKLSRCDLDVAGWTCTHRTLSLRYYWIFAITVGVGLLFGIFGAFETMFYRSLANVDGRVVITDQYGVTQLVPDEQAQEHLDQVDHSNTLEHAPIPPKHAYSRSIRLWSTPVKNPVRTMFVTWTQMAVALTSPAILYAVLATSTSLAGLIFMSLTYDSVLQDYGWPAKSVGLINIGGIIGAFIAMAYSTLLAEPLNLWLAKRNRGIHTPEHRLIALVPAFAIGFASLLMYGFTSTGASSEWPVLIAYSMFQTSWISLLITTSAFAVEASPRFPGSALVMVVGTKNIVSFGTSHGLSSTIGVRQFSWSFGIIAGIYGAIALLGVPVYLLNPRWRSYVGQRAAHRL